METRFSLGGGGRTGDTTQGGRADGTAGAIQGGGHHSSAIDIDDWDNASEPLGDDPSAPNVSTRFGERGDRATVDRAVNDYFFALGGGGAGPTEDAPGISAPPREITQQWTQEERGAEAQATDLATTTYTATEATTYSGMGAAIRKGGLGMKATITQDLAWQRSVGVIQRGSTNGRM
jgi:hypothetical protein